LAPTVGRLKTERRAWEWNEQQIWEMVARCTAATGEKMKILEAVGTEHYQREARGPGKQMGNWPNDQLQCQNQTAGRKWVSARILHALSTHSEEQKTLMQDSVKWKWDSKICCTGETPNGIQRENENRQEKDIVLVRFSGTQASRTTKRKTKTDREENQDGD
jgi:hypothetical protein